jgi:hypothetical protein
MGKPFEDCANCKGMILGRGTSEGDLRFCSVACQRFYHQPGFCDSCVSQTTPESVTGTFAYRGSIGTRMLGFGRHCEKCNSIVKRKWYWLVLPLFPIGEKYRILRLSRTRYQARKLKYDPS